jgi:HEPN domain-containing protein
MNAGRPESAWFRKGERDLRAAELAVAAADPMPDIACYHAQQCAEKHLKGYLVACRVPFRYVHELAYLAGLCAERDASFGAIMDAAATLQDYATDVRYPEEDGTEPTTEDGGEAIRLARLIADFVRTKTPR